MDNASRTPPIHRFYPTHYSTMASLRHELRCKVMALAVIHTHSLVIT